MINSKKRRNKKQTTTNKCLIIKEKNKKNQKKLSFCLCSFPKANDKSLGGETVQLE